MAFNTGFLVVKGSKLLTTPAVQKAGISALKCGFGMLKGFVLAHPVVSGVAATAIAVKCLLDDD